MKSGILKVDPRTTTRSMRMAIQGDVIRGLVELITNADDSYARLEDKGEDINHGKIDIVYRKDGHKGIFEVRDYAEGMSENELEKSFTTWGGATSGLIDNVSVRGYFGRGAKDTLATMLDGRLVTFQNNTCTECRLYIELNQAKYTILDPIRATKKVRGVHGIQDNGTVAYFSADPSKTGPVPKFGTIQEALSNNYMLRKIMTDPRREVYLINGQTEEKRTLRYQYPEGSEVLSESFEIHYSSYESFTISLSVWRADGELNQTGDDREGGLLISDDQDAVLDISLFKYNNEPLASHFYGDVVVGGFRELLRNEEAVLSDKREGLEKRHPFCRELIEKIDVYLSDLVDAERDRKRKEETKVGADETRRYKNGMDILNEIANQKLEEVIDLAAKHGEDKDEYPPDGFCLFPSLSQISVGKKGNLELRYDTGIVRPGTRISLKCSSSAIRLHTADFTVSKDETEGIYSRKITIEGIEPNSEGLIIASAGKRQTEARIIVLEEKELLMHEGLLFQPESITLRPAQPRKVYLLVYIKKIEGGNVITLQSDNDSINLSISQITVCEPDAVRHVAKYEVELWGEGAGQDGIITAECQGSLALLDVRVRSKPDKKPTGPKGMFTEPEFNEELHPLQRTSYSKKSGKVNIYVNFPSVKHYLGENRIYSSSLPAQIFIADLIAEQCFNEIAREMIERSGIAVSPQNLPYQIRRDANDLSKEFGKKVHIALVDQNKLKDQQELSLNGNG